MRSRLDKHQRNVLIRSLSMLLQGFPGIKSPVCVRFGYNSLKSCWFCDEKLMLSFCAARDTHFSAFNCVFVILNSLITIQHFLSRSLHFSSVLFDYGDRRVFLKLVSGMS